MSIDFIEDMFSISGYNPTTTTLLFTLRLVINRTLRPDWCVALSGEPTYNQFGWSTYLTQDQKCDAPDHKILASREGATHFWFTDS